MYRVQMFQAVSRIITKRRAFARLLRASVRRRLRHSSAGDWTARASVLSLVVAVMWWSGLQVVGGQEVGEQEASVQVASGQVAGGQAAGGQVAGRRAIDVPLAAQISATSALTATVGSTVTAGPPATATTAPATSAILAAPTPTPTGNLSQTATLTTSAALTGDLAFTDAPGDVILAAPIALEDEAIEGSVSTTDVVSSGEAATGDSTDGDSTDGDSTDGDNTDGDSTDGDSTDGDNVVDAVNNVEQTRRAPAGGEGVIAGSELVGDVVGNLDALFGDAVTDSADAEATPLPTGLPRVRIVPGTTGRIPRFPTVTPTVGPPPPTATPTQEPLPVVKGRLWSNFEPLPPSEADHFWIGRAFPAGTQTQLASPNYQFGSTAGGRYRAHHGVDIGNPQGTPVFAATEGTVVHAGPDADVLLGPYNNFYGNTVVIRLERQLPVAGGALDVFLLYGHLSGVTVEVGQTVTRDEVVGAVGMTGIAIGPHLHVEVRVGANTYEHNVNPYLWMEPLPGTGAVAVRVLSADGRTWPGAVVGLAQYRADGSASWGRQIITYQDIENIGPDPAWGENGAMDGVPPGNYRVATVINGERIAADIVVNAGETTFVEMRTQQ